MGDNKETDRPMHAVDFASGYVRLVDGYPGMAYRCLNDEFWTMKFISANGPSVTGYRNEDLLDNKVVAFEDLILPEYKNTIRQLWKDALREERDFEFEYEIITKDKTIKWVHERGHGIRDDHNQVIYVEGFITDISQEKESALREKKHEDRFRHITENSPIPILICHEEKIIYLNPACRDLFVVKDDNAILGKKLYQFLDPKYHSFYKSRIKKIQETRTPSTRAEYKMFRSDGSEAYVEISSSPFFDGDEMYLHVFFYDMTEKHFRLKQMKRIQKRSRDLIVGMHEGIGIFTGEKNLRKFKLIFSNRSLPRLLFDNITRVIGTEFSELFPMIEEKEASRIFQSLELGEDYCLELELASGKFLSTRFLMNDDQEVIVVLNDISDIKAKETSLIAEKRKLDMIIEGTNTGLWDWHLEKDTIDINFKWAQISGYTLEELVPLTVDRFYQLVHKDDVSKVKQAINDYLWGHGDKTLVEYRLQSKNGDYEWFVDRGTITKRDQFQKPLMMSGTHQNITERKNRELEIMNLSYYDHLTGLYNRRKFEEVLKQLDNKDQLPLSIVMGDVNALKLTNDAFGHQAGDALISHISQKLKATFNDTEHLFRIGGDEFVVILTKKTRSEVHKKLKSLTSELENEIVNNFPCSVAFGLSTRTSMNKPMRDVFRDAELVMYNSKLIRSDHLRVDMIDRIKRFLYENCPAERIHANLVKDYMFKLASKFDLAESDRKSLVQLAEIHDIGKIAIPPHILNKSEPLSASEIRIIHQHPETGYRILISAYEYDKIAVDVLSHHERWDGTGYPKKLREDEIPWKARFLSICEAYASMTVDQPYRKALSKEDAVKELINNSGKQFDPEICQFFVLEVLDEKWD